MTQWVVFLRVTAPQNHGLSIYLKTVVRFGYMLEITTPRVQDEEGRREKVKFYATFSLL
jgi:hypothetical protein